VTTNKIIATIVGNVFGKDVQAYPKYGSEKKGLLTTYYLTDRRLAHHDAQRAGTRRSAVHHEHDAILDSAPLSGLQPGGSSSMQSPPRRPGRVWKADPAQCRRSSATQVRVCYADMVKIARDQATRADLQIRMQGIVLLGAFLRLTAVRAGKAT